MITFKLAILLYDPPDVISCSQLSYTWLSVWVIAKASYNEKAIEFNTLLGTVHCKTVRNYFKNAFC